MDEELEPTPAETSGEGQPLDHVAENQPAPEKDFLQVTKELSTMPEMAAIRAGAKERAEKGELTYEDFAENYYSPYQQQAEALLDQVSANHREAAQAQLIIHLAMFQNEAGFKEAAMEELDQMIEVFRMGGRDHYADMLELTQIRIKPEMNEEDGQKVREILSRYPDRPTS